MCKLIFIFVIGLTLCGFCDMPYKGLYKGEVPINRVYRGTELCWQKVTGPWTPNSISGCCLWMDPVPEQVHVNGSGAVITWVDKSANGFVFTNYMQMGTTSPTFTNNHVTFNRKNALFCPTYVNDNLIATWFIVVAPSGSPGIFGYTFCGRSPNMASVRFHLGINQGYRAVLSYNGTISAPAGFVVPHDAPTLFVGRFNPAPLTTSLYTNGFICGSSTTLAAPTNPNHPPFAIGGAFGSVLEATGSSPSLLTGWIGELVQYNRALSDEEIAVVSAYLKARWGL